MSYMKNTSKRVLALILSVVLLLSMLPVGSLSVLAITDSSLTTDIAEKTFFVDTEVNFTFATTAGTDDVNKMVLGTFTLLDENGEDARDAVESLQYLDVSTGEYCEFYGDFGPAATGFPLMDATSNFKVTFNRAGTYTVKAAIINFADRSTLVSAADTSIVVKPRESELLTDINTKSFINNNQVDFTYSTVANAYENTMVLGTFSILDENGDDAQEAVGSLKYLDVSTGEYCEFYGDFGPAATGFPLKDATSKFRVTFQKAGTYTVYAAMKKFDGGEILCENTQVISVQKEGCTLTTDLTGKTLELAGTMTFTYSTVANDYADTAVLGVFKLEKNGADAQSCVNKLEYWDVQNSCYREFYGDFGPAETGFPLSDATSTFRVSLNESGTYTVTVQMVTFEGREVLCKNVTTIEVKDTTTPVISKVTGNPDNWVKGSANLVVTATDNSGSVAQYRVNEGDWQDSNEFAITENGTYTFYAKDASGNVSAASQEIVVSKLDNDYPVIGVITLDPSDWTNQTVTLTVPAEDSGIGEILYRMDDGQWQSENTFTINDNLQHKIYVKDTLGNENPVAVEIVADKYDDKAPVIESVTPNTTEWVNDKVTITVAATDEGVQLIGYSLTTDETSWQQSNALEITENGTYYVYVRDGLKNTVETPTEIVITNIDKIDPEIQGLTATTTEWTNQDSVTISGKVFDGESGTTKLEYKINDGEWIEYSYQEDNTFEITETSEGIYTYTFRCYDKAGNVSEEKTVTVKLDRTLPKVDGTADITEWTNTDVEISGSVSDDASGIVKVYIQKDGAEEWIAVENFDAAAMTYVYKIAAQDYEGAYHIRSEDAAGNKSEILSVNVKMDTSIPEVTELLANPAVWTKEAVVISGSVEDDLSGVAKVFIRKAGDEIWQEVDDFNTETLTFEDTVKAQNYEGKYDICCKDNAGNESEIASVDVYMDVTAPTELTVEYIKPVWIKIGELFGFTKDTVNVKLSAKDALAGIDYIEYSLNGEAYNKVEYDGDKEITYDAINIPAGYRGKVSFRVTDRSGNTTEYTDEENRTVVVDALAPKMVNSEVKYSFTDNQYVTADNIYYTQGDVNILLVIEEANFDLSLRTAEGEENAPVPVAVVENLLTGVKESKEIAWDQVSESNRWTGNIDISGEGDYLVTVNFTDRAGNPMDTYQQEIHIDKTAPVIKDYVFTQGNVKNTNNGRIYYQESQALTVQVVEHNFDPAGVELVVEAENATVEIPADDIKAFAQDITNWVQDAENPDLYTLGLNNENGMIFNIQANYTLRLTVTDYAEKGTTAEHALFTIDWTAPEQPVITYSKKAVLKVIEGLTFGFYQAPLTVTVSSEDEIAGVKEIKYTYNGTKGIYDPETIVVDKVEQTDGSINFEMDVQFAGVVTATARDWSDNANTQTIGKDTANKEMQGIVLDNVKPKRTVILSNAERVVCAENLTDYEKSEYDYTSEGPDTILYYKDSATVTFRITEANFFPEDVHVKVNGVETNPTDWTVDENSVAIGTITISEEGDHIVTMTYTDKSGNKMDDYTSHRIVIDKTLPEIGVVFSGEEAAPQYTNNEGREFYQKSRTATITITEHNFRADDVEVSIMAKQANGDNVTVGTFSFDAAGNIIEGEFQYTDEQLVEQYIDFARIRTQWTDYEDKENWRREDNTFIIEIPFNAEANYTFDIAYNDLATNAAEDYPEKLFTIDNYAPQLLEIEYSEDIENSFNDPAFYYGDQMLVTISAQDDISGVYGFVYSYLLNDGVSEVNKELKDQEIIEGMENSTWQQNVDNNGNLTNIFSATFHVPKDALTEDNQFNGYISFNATDRANNSSVVATGEQTLVVDNIPPFKQVTHNDATHKEGNVSYYAGNIETEIVITEANFFSEDVKVTVTRDGISYPVNVSWNDNSVDVHTGTFTLTEDGDYEISVTYTDRSNNMMEAYKSNQLTIDTKDPVIRIDQIMHESANNGETIGFILTVTDTNIPAENIKPEFSVIVKKDNGNNLFDFVPEPLDLGEPAVSTNANGETVYTYTVENLEADGYYTLTCEATDYAKHTVTAINSTTAADTVLTTEKVNFSVNREGSVFWIETEHTDKYTGETLTNLLNGVCANDTVKITLYEINVDMVDQYGKSTVFTVNDGSQIEDIILEEGVNYTKNVIQGVGGWYKTQYVLENDVFDHDGDYSLNVITYDKANNSNVNTKSEAGTIRFTLDRTNPVISANVTSEQRIDATEYWVQFEIAETNLKEDTIVVKLFNKKGVEIETELEALGNNMYKFRVASGLRYDIEISAQDYAGNASEVCRIDDLTISDNFLVLWYANTPWFWGSIGGVLLVAGLVILLIILKKKKEKK